MKREKAPPPNPGNESPRAVQTATGEVQSVLQRTHETYRKSEANKSGVAGQRHSQARFFPTSSRPRERHVRSVTWRSAKSWFGHSTDVGRVKPEGSCEVKGVKWRFRAPQWRPLASSALSEPLDPPAADEGDDALN
jgi:hypothetical protein